MSDAHLPDPADPGLPDPDRPDLDDLLGDPGVTDPVEPAPPIEPIEPVEPTEPPVRADGPPDRDRGPDGDQGRRGHPSHPDPTFEPAVPGPADEAAVDLDDAGDGRDDGPPAPPAGPIDLSLDSDAAGVELADEAHADAGRTPADLAGGIAGAEADGSPIDLSLDEGALDPRDELPQVSFESTPVDLDLSPTGGNGWLPETLIAAAVGALAVGAVPLARLRGRTAPPDLVAALEELDIDARVEHGDRQLLNAWLGDGHQVLLGTDGSAGLSADDVLEIRRIDEAAGHLDTVDGEGRQRMFDLDRFEAAWAESAHQVIVASGDRRIMLLPVVLADADRAGVE